MAQINTIKRGNKWQYWFEGEIVDGKRKQYSKSGFLTKKEALIAGTKALNEYLNDGCISLNSEITFEEFSEIWFDKYCKNNIKERTQQMYRYYVRKSILPYIGSFKMTTIKTMQIQEIFMKFYKFYSSVYKMCTITGYYRTYL